MFIFLKIPPNHFSKPRVATPCLLNYTERVIYLHTFFAPREAPPSELLPEAVYSASQPGRTRVLLSWGWMSILTFLPRAHLFYLDLFIYLFILIIIDNSDFLLGNQAPSPPFLGDLMLFNLVFMFFFFNIYIFIYFYLFVGIDSPYPPQFLSKRGPHPSPFLPPNPTAHSLVAE